MNEWISRDGAWLRLRGVADVDECARCQGNTQKLDVGVDDSQQSSSVCLYDEALVVVKGHSIVA